jgi:hypothetical protein
MIVYTLTDATTDVEALAQLRKTAEMLPEGATENVCRRSEQGMDVKLQWVPFGDLVQTIDFPHGWQAQQFDDSEAYHDQERRCKGMFANIAFLNCTVIDDMIEKQTIANQERKLNESRAGN